MYLKLVIIYTVTFPPYKNKNRINQMKNELKAN